MDQMPEGSRTWSSAATSTTSIGRGPVGRPGAEFARGQGGEAGRAERKGLHHGLAAGNGNDPVEGLAAAEVGALVFVREQASSLAPAPRQDTSVRPAKLDPQRLVGRAVHRVRQELERRRIRCRRAPERLLESHHLLAQLAAHLLNGEHAPDEQVVPDRVGEQEQGQDGAGDQPGRRPSAGSARGPACWPGTNPGSVAPPLLDLDARQDTRGGAGPRRAARPDPLGDVVARGRARRAPASEGSRG